MRLAFPLRFCILVSDQKAGGGNGLGTRLVQVFYHRITVSFSARLGMRLQRSPILKISLVPRPFPPPVFDRLQYAKTEGEGLGERVTCVTSGRREGRQRGGGA